MRLRIRNGRAVMGKQTPPGKVKVRRKDNGKVTFVSPETLESHPDRYDTARSRREEKQNRKDLARQEREKRNLEYQKQKAEQPEPTRTEKGRQDALHKKKIEREEKKQKLRSRVKQRIKKKKQKARQEQKDRRKQLQDKAKQIQEQRDRTNQWSKIKDDHPELSPKEQEDRQKTFMETGVDSGGRSTKAIRWWFKNYGGGSQEEGSQPKRLDKKSIQDHFKYGPKPNKKGECSGGLKAIPIRSSGGSPFTICVDPNVYDLKKGK